MSTGSALTPIILGMHVLEPLLTVVHDWGAVLAATGEPEAQEVTGFGLARGGIDRGILIYRMGESQISSVSVPAAGAYHVVLHPSPDVAAPSTALGMAQDSRVLMEYGYDYTQATAVGWAPAITIEQMTDTPPEAILLVQNPALIISSFFTAAPTNPVVRFWYKWVELERATFNALVRR